MSYTSDTLQCILNIKQTQINVLVIQCQTHLGKIFKCTIFVGYGGVINFEWCRTIYLPRVKFAHRSIFTRVYFWRMRIGLYHGGDSIDTTCAVVRDVTAYIAVVRVFRFSSEYYGCRYHRCPYFSAHRANRSSLISAFITENCQEGIYRYYKCLSSFLNIKTIQGIYF